MYKKKNKQITKSKTSNEKYVMKGQTKTKQTKLVAGEALQHTETT